MICLLTLEGTNRKKKKSANAWLIYREFPLRVWLCMPRGGVPSHSKHFCTLNPKVFGFHVSMQMGNAWQGHFHAKSIWYAGLTTRIMFMIEKAFSCPPRSSLRIGNLLRAIFRVRLHTIWHFYELYSSAAFFSLRIRWNFQS